MNLKRIPAGPIFFLGLILFIFGCSSSAPKVDRLREDGVEVVVNHLQPYRIEGEPSDFELEELFVIDTEDEEVAELGLTDIGTFMGTALTVDEAGNVYLYSPESTEPLLYKFDTAGRFMDAFARRGQGPGEFQRDIHLGMAWSGSGGKNLAVTDVRSSKITILRPDGNLIREIKLTGNIIVALPLDDECYLLRRRFSDPRGKNLVRYPLCLADADFNDIMQLDCQSIPNPMTGERLKGFYYTFAWAVADGKIFTGFQERGYDLFVYAFDGSLVRKIRKQYRRIPVSRTHKNKFMSQFDAPMFEDVRKKIYFPDHMPPFHGFFADDDGRLFVMTYEEGDIPGSFMYDVFNPEGVFVCRKSLSIFQDEGGVKAAVRNGRLYALQEKASGFKRLVVSRILWQ